MAVNLAQKYSDIVAERFKVASTTDLVFNQSYNFDGVDTVKVYSVSVPTLGNYTRSGANRYGTPAELDDTLQTLQLTQDKAFTYTVDKGNNIEQLNVKDAATTLARTIKEVIVPAVDTYRFGKLAAAATAATQVVTTAPTKDNIIDLINQLDIYLSEAEVPKEGRYLWVNETGAGLIRVNSEFTRLGDSSNPLNISGEIGSVFSKPVIEVPSSRFPANTIAIMGYGNGVVAPIKLAEYKIHQDPPGINGDLVEGRIIHDAFVLNAKANGFAMIQTP